MADYKAVIAALCKSLNLMCDINVKPEHFRLAKYNKTENNVISVFWKVLNIFNPINENENMIQNIKLYFASLTYTNIEFYCLPDDMTYGSRELLLAFSWLLAHKNVLEIKLKEILYNTTIKDEFQSVLCDDKSKELQDHLQLDTIEDYHNYILWGVGKLNQNKKIVTEFSNKTADILMTVHIEKSNVQSTAQLSTAEILFTKAPENLNSYLYEVKNVSLVLDNYLKWEKMEKYYWNWMKTVLDEKIKNANRYTNGDLNNAVAFLKYLKMHLKQNIKCSLNCQQEEENYFPRCILKSESSSFCLRNPQKLAKKLNAVSLDNKTKNINLEAICNFLENFL